MNLAPAERAALCASLDDAGPDAPTLCAGWSTLDLAAHLVMRERRPLAAAGLMGGPLAGHTHRVHSEIAASVPYPRLVALVRAGPPRLSVFGLPGADELLNLVEFFVHHEDVRRAAADWAPRDLSPAFTAVLWSRLRAVRRVFRDVGVGVELVRDDDATARRVRITASARTPVVTVTGHPAELTVWAAGRVSAARVALAGPDDAVRVVSQGGWRL